MFVIMARRIVCVYLGTKESAECRASNVDVMSYNNAIRGNYLFYFLFASKAK